MTRNDNGTCQHWRALFTIDREMVSPDNETQVAHAKLLRTKLMEYRLSES